MKKFELFSNHEKIENYNYKHFNIYILTVNILIFLISFGAFNVKVSRAGTADEAKVFIQNLADEAVNSLTGGDISKVCLLYTSPSPRD